MNWYIGHNDGMNGRPALFRILITNSILALVLVSCASGARTPDVLDYGAGLQLARSAAASENGISPSPTSTPVLPTFTLAPTGTPSPTNTSTDTETATPTRRPFAYVFPVQPPKVADFADGGHAYPATDIFAPVGTNFVAVTDGVVDFVSYKDVWDPAANDQAVAGGLSIAIIGDDGIRYYGSHLSAIAGGIAPGVRVTAGQLLGLSGKTGNAANTTPHVHFGISHPTFPADWAVRRGELDPYPYLLAWLRGENITPQFPTPTPSSVSPNSFTEKTDDESSLS
jgi:murein DD-endopeptidase MepM/ murein hydrolase activator NlpD